MFTVCWLINLSLADFTFIYRTLWNKNCSQGVMFKIFNFGAHLLKMIWTRTCRVSYCHPVFSKSLNIILHRFFIHLHNANQPNDKTIWWKGYFYLNDLMWAHNRQTHHLWAIYIYTLAGGQGHYVNYTLSYVITGCINLYTPTQTHACIH